jgi:hypothetical protein
MRLTQSSLRFWNMNCFWFFSSKSPLICHSCFGPKNCSTFELASTGLDNSCSLENDIQGRWVRGTSNSCKFLRSSTSIPIFLFCYLSPCIMTDRQTDSQTMQPGWVDSKNCIQKTWHYVSCMIGGFPSGSPQDGFCFMFFTSISMTEDNYYLHITILEQRLHTYL